MQIKPVPSVPRCNQTSSCMTFAQQQMHEPVHQGSLCAEQHPQNLITAGHDMHYMCAGLEAHVLLSLIPQRHDQTQLGSLHMMTCVCPMLQPGLAVCEVTSVKMCG